MSTSDGARQNRTHMAALVAEHVIGSQELALSLDSITRLIALAEAAYMDGKNDASTPDLLAALRAVVARLRGEWDQPDLVAFGPLMAGDKGAISDVLAIAQSALAKARA